MNIDLLRQLGWFFLFLLAQVVVLGRIHLFGCATPLLYVYFILQFPRNYPKWGLLLWAFMMGLGVDVFNNTPGLAAASLTCVAAVAPYYFELFLPRDMAESLRPSVATIGLLKYSYFVVPMVLLFCVALYSLEQFSLLDPMQWVRNVAGSSLVTLALIFTFEIARLKGDKQE